MKEGGMFSSHTYAGKSDEFRGLIYIWDKRVDTTGIKYKKIGDINDSKKFICAIEGSWLWDLIIDGKRYWSVDDEEQRPYR